MSLWVPAVAAGLTGLFTAWVQRSRLGVMAFVALCMALGVCLIVFEWKDAARAALGDAPLDGTAPDDLARRRVRCAHATWQCEHAAELHEDAFEVPFACGGATVFTAMFYGAHPECTALPPTVTGYLMDMNEAGGGAPAWVLRVPGGPPTTFPGFLSFMGAAFVVLAFASPRVFAWAKTRQAATPRP